MPDFRGCLSSVNDGVLRLAADGEGSATGRPGGRRSTRVGPARARPNVVIAVGNRIPLSGLDQWLGELRKRSPIRARPLDPHQVHARRSAVGRPDRRHRIGELQRTEHRHQRREHAGDPRQRGSPTSTRGEFFRLHAHYAFRQTIGIFLRNNPDRTVEDFASRFLSRTGDWTRGLLHAG